MITLTFNQLKVLTQATAFGCIYSSIIAFNALRTVKKQEEEYRKLFGMIRYLVSIMEEQQVEISEFDMIALSELGFRVSVVEESE